MKIDEVLIDNAVVLKIIGNLTEGNELIALQGRVKALAADEIKTVILELNQVKHINSFGLGALMACKNTMEVSNGKLALANVSDRVVSVLKISKYINVFDVYKDTEEALNKYK